VAQRFILVPESAAEAVPRRMAEDLLTVTQIPEEAIDALAERVAQAPGFVDGKRLHEIIHSLAADAKQATALTNVISNLTPRGLSDAIENIASWRGQSPKNAEFFPDTAFQTLQKRLPRLIRDFPALERYRKATRLKSTLGTHVQGVELICDLRPVFDKKREKIEGLVPITVLKLRCQGQNDEPLVIEVILGGQMVEELRQEVEKAQRKLKIIHATADQWTPDGVIEPD
jgi:hypothetical protein